MAEKVIIKSVSELGGLMKSIQIRSKFIMDHKDNPFLITSENDSFCDTGASVKVKQLYFNKGDHYLGEEFETRISNIKGIISKTNLPKNLQIENPNIVIVNNYQAMQWTNKRKQSKNLENYIPSIFIKPKLKLLKADYNKLPIEYTSLIIKPVEGFRGRSVYLIPRDFKNINKTILKIRKEIKRDKGVLIQAYIPAESIDSLNGLGTENNKLLKSCNKACELRVFVALRPDWDKEKALSVMHVTGRHVVPWTNKDFWINLKQESIPKEVLNIAYDTTKLIMNDSKSQGIFLAADIIFNNGKYYIMELNVKNPAIPKPKESKVDSKTISMNFAEIFK